MIWEPETGVAIKVINTVTNDNYVQRTLLREAQLLSQLTHPNIVRLFQCFTCSSAYCLVTELIPGVNLILYTSKEKDQRLDEDTTRYFARQIASGLAYIHRRGMVHRDLKMDNILVDYGRTIKIVDFGLGNTWSEEKPLGTQCGTLEYSAPELFRKGECCGPKVDIWALGIVLYSLAAGQFPFRNSRDLRTVSDDYYVSYVRKIHLGLAEKDFSCLGDCSSEFRDVLNKLVCPLVNVRYTADDALKHDWFTNRRKWTPPEDFTFQVDSYQRSQILETISASLKISMKTINEEMKRDKYGEIGGMYNILAYQQETACLSNTACNVIAEEENYKIKNLSVFKAQSNYKAGYYSTPIYPSYSKNYNLKKLLIVGSSSNTHSSVSRTKVKTIQMKPVYDGKGDSMSLSSSQNSRYFMMPVPMDNNFISLLISPVCNLFFTFNMLKQQLPK